MNRNLPWRASQTSMLALSALVMTSAVSHGIVAGEAAQDANGVRSVTIRIDSSKGELCTGVVINPQTILTAAHCVLGGGSFTVTSLGPDFRPRRHKVAQVMVHPSFVRGTTPRTQPGADLAMIRLAAPLPADMGAVFVGSGLWNGEGLTISGFGLAVEGRNASARSLRQARLVTSGTYTSANSVTVAVDETRLGQEAGAGACRGDSGGPALRGSASSRDLVGIVSWTSGPMASLERRVCGGFTSITPVAEHASWIAATTAASGTTTATGETVAAKEQAQAIPAAPSASGSNAMMIER